MNGANVHLKVVLFPPYNEECRWWGGGVGRQHNYYRTGFLQLAPLFLWMLRFF